MLRCLQGRSTGHLNRVIKPPSNNGGENRLHDKSPATLLLSLLEVPLPLHVRSPTFRHEWLPHICGFPNASGRAILPTIYNCRQFRDILDDEDRNTCHLSSVRTMQNLYYAVGISFHAVYSFSNHWCESVQPLQLPTILL